MSKNAKGTGEGEALEKGEGNIKSRSANLVKEIRTEISLLSEMYTGCVDVISNPSERMEGEILVMVENTHYTHFRIVLSLRIKLMFGYPSVEPKMKCDSKMNISDREAEIIMNKARECASKLASIGENSLADIVSCVYREIEEKEEQNHREEALRRLKEEQEAEMKEKAKRQEEELKRSEEERKIKMKIQSEQKLNDLNKLINGGLVEPQIDDDTAFNLKRQMIESYMVERKLSNSDQYDHDSKSIGVDGIVSVRMKKSIEENDMDDDTSVQGSRFNHDFIMINRLGEGAFGQVFKVQNKLDGNTYAVKRLVLKYKSQKRLFNNKLLLEVQVLSQLNHMNVVRYYQAWTEPVPEDDLSHLNKLYDDHSDDDDDDDSGEEESSRSIHITGEKSESSGSHSNSSQSNKITSKNMESSFNLVFLDSKGDFQTNNKLSNISKDKNWKEAIMNELSKQELEEDGKKDENKETLKYLFIQMECCELMTLRDFIDKGELRKDRSLFIKLITQILEAFTYIHQFNMIHRDVKPSNIFLDRKQNIKIGDFGLATTGGLYVNKLNDKSGLNGTTSDNLDSQPEDTNNLEAVGTPIYMSPEQSKGGKYDSKADMFSLGIIMYEMAYGPFRAEAERIVTISALRKEKKLPTDFDQRSEMKNTKVSRIKLTEDQRDYHKTSSR